MRRKLLKTLCLCALSCFAAGTFGVSLRANAEEYSKNAAELITTNGFNVTYNVAGNEAQEGLTNDTAKGILFQTEQTGAAAKGASLTFENSLSGLFELNFRAFTEVKDTSGSWWDGGAWYDRTNSEELREMAITVTDEETGEKFTVYVKGGTEWNAYTPNARVAYGAAGEYYGSGRWYTEYSDNPGYKNNDKGLSNTTYNTAIFGTSFVNRARNDGGEIAGGGYSTNIGFDPVSKEVYAYVYGKAEKYQCYKRVILDLDDAEDFSYLTQTSAGKRDGEVGAAFQKSTFKKYNVQVSVTDVTEGKAAAFLIYHLNGQSLGGEGGKIVSSVALGAAVVTPEGKQYREYTLPQPVLRGVLGESSEFTGTVEVKAPGGTTVFAEAEYVSGLKFTPEEYGEYTLIYRGIVSLSGAGRKTFAAGAVYSGAELSYEYPFTVKKSNRVTGNAAELITTSGFNVTYNVAGNEAQEGLTNDTAKGILFQTEQTGVAAKGASLTFENSLSGLFELNFRAFTEVKDTSGSWWDGGAWYDRTNSEELREMAITVTDEETGEKFTVYVKGGTEWNAYTPNARVAYGAAGEYYGSGRWYTEYSDNPGYKNNDKGLSNTTYNTAIFGTSFVNRARNDGGEIAGGGYSTNIGFDPVSKEVYAYVYGKAGNYKCYKRVILDLDDGEDLPYLKQTSAGKKDGEVGAGFQKSTFKKYNVQVSVTDVTEGKAAAFLIYHLNGQSLGGENGVLTSNTAPVPVGGTYEAKIYENGMTAEIPAPELCSIAEKSPVFNGKVKVLNGAGATVLEETAWRQGLTFSPEKADTYKIVYTSGTDAAGNTRKTYNFNYSGTINADVKVSAECELPIVKAAVANASVSLKGNVAINYYADLSSELTGESSAATAVFKNAAGETLGEPIALNAVQAETSGEMQGKYKFSYPVAARDYQEKITLTVLENGAEIAGLSYSVNDYIVAVNAMESASAELKNAVNALKAYCEAARAYFAGETVASAEAADLSAFADVIEKAEASEAEDADINMSLLLKSGTELRIYFKGDLDCTIGGAAAEKRAAKAEGYYYVSVEDIAAKDLGAEQVLTIGNYTIKCSALSYAAAVEGIVSEETSVVNLKNLVRALYAYYAAANAYFGANV